MMNRKIITTMMTILIFVVMAAMVPVQASRPITFKISPTGSDDTANIQAAFDACSGIPGCKIQLEKGTYYISQIVAYDFRGTFLGMGEKHTTIQALPNLPSPTVYPYWAEMPGPGNPWPDLFTFVNGAFSISKMTLTDPYADPTSWQDGSPSTSLFTAIFITGKKASAAIDHVTVLGAPGDQAGTNMWNAIVYAGTLLPTGYTDPFADTIPLSGTFSMTDCVCNYEESGPYIYNIVNARVTVCDNTFINCPWPVCFSDLSKSTVLFRGNRATGVTICGIAGGQGKLGLLPSTVYIVDNVLQVRGDGTWGAPAIYMGDWTGEASTLNLVVSKNTLQTDTSYGGYDPTNPLGCSVIVSSNLKSLVVSHNKIIGGGSAGVCVTGGPGEVSENTITGSYVGIWLDNANGIKVTDNAIKNSKQWGIALTDGSSNNLITKNEVKNSGAYDLYWDGSGSDNVWKANKYTTSNF